MSDWKDLAKCARNIVLDSFVAVGFECFWKERLSKVLYNTVEINYENNFYAMLTIY